MWGRLEEEYKRPALLSIEMGMRIGEILALQWDAIDWEHNCIRIIRTYSGYPVVDLPKEGREKWLEMKGRVRETLEALRKESATLWLFVHPTKARSRIWPQQLSQAWKTAAREIGLPKARLHHNRNSFAIDRRAEGFSSEETAEMLGHLTIASTRIYTGPQPKMLKRIIDMDKRKRMEKTPE